MYCLLFQNEKHLGNNLYSSALKLEAADCSYIGGKFLPGDLVFCISEVSSAHLSRKYVKEHVARNKISLRILLSWQ
jgi:hypothetical protein